MKRKTHTQPFVLRLLAAVCASVLWITCLDLCVPASESDIYGAVIRLHVLANSDSAEDQRVKYLVRDAIVAECGELFSETETVEQAVLQTENAMERMEAIANRVLAEQGCSYTAHAVFGKETYPTREYDGVRFPAGEYRSLRILLGDGEGQNWWCCLFPPLCLRSASDKEEERSSVGIDVSSGKVFTQKKYRIRFKLLEWMFG